MVVSNELDTLRQRRAVCLGDQIERNLRRSIRLHLGWSTISFPMRKVNAVVDRAVDRKLGNVFEGVCVKLESHDLAFRDMGDFGKCSVNQLMEEQYGRDHTSRTQATP